MKRGAYNVKRPSIKDVAREAGVSTATVSYVLNNRPGETISAETTARVQEAVVKLQYVPNLNARSLPSRRTNLIGVVIAQTEPGKEFMFSNPFYGELLSAVEYTARKSGYHLLLSGMETDQSYLHIARNRGVELTVITSTPNPTGYEDGVMNFRSIGDFVLPEYPDLKLHFPPVLDIIDYFEREGFTRIHVSTPGTVGLLALSIAKLMDFPIAGTYHTDIPQYVRSLTSDEMLEKAAWQFMIWFYGRMDEVMVPSASTRRQLVERGLAEEKMKPLPRWVDVRRFSPERRDPGFWDGYSANRSMKFIYVGRVSREKNLELLADAFMEVAAGALPAQLVIVGDGPYLGELRKKLSGYPVIFTGFLQGAELSVAYASSDVFVFPSTTDTFGNVVLEAQASGLPVIVSDSGGPKELMLDGVTGFVAKADNRKEFADSMRSMLRDPAMTTKMGKNARSFTEQGAAADTDACYAILRPTATTF